MTLVDLIHQVQKALPIRFGGTGVPTGESRGVVLLYVNLTGSTIPLYSTVGLRTGHDDGRIELTSSAGDRAFIGVVVGRGVAAGDERFGSWEPIAPADGQQAAVMISGRTLVLVSSAVTRKQYASVSATAGKAQGTSTTPSPGTFGIFETAGSSQAIVLIQGGRSGAVPATVEQVGTQKVSSLTELDFLDSILTRGSGGIAAMEVEPVRLFLDAKQVKLADAGAYYTAPSPASGIETLRPTSDFAKAGSIVYTPSGTNGYALVDEAVFDGSDYYFLGNGAYIIHGFPATALDTDKRITSLTFKMYVDNPAPAANATIQIRDPQTGDLYVLDTIGQNPTHNRSVTATTRPWDGHAWTLDDLRHLQWGLFAPSSSSNIYNSHMYVEVNWTAPKTVETALADIGAGVVSGGGGGGGGGGTGTAFIGARAYHAAYQAVTDSTQTPLLLDTHEYDTDNLHFESAANLTGTVSKTAASAAIVGSGTSFTTELSVNQVISIPGTATEIGVVKSITDNTHLTLWQTMANTASGQTAKRRSEFFAIPLGLGGKYHVEASTWAGGLTAGFALAEFQRNGVTVNGSYARASFATSTAPALALGMDIALADGDYLTATVYHNKGSNCDFGYNTPPVGAVTGMSLAKIGSGGLGQGIGASVRYSAALNVTASPQTILWNTEDYDTSGYHDLSTNTGRFTVPAGLGGWHAVHCVAEYDSTGAGFRLRLYKNGATVVALSMAKDDDFLFEVHDLVYLAAGDYLEVQAVGVTTGQMINSDVQSHFSIARIDSGRPTDELDYVEITSQVSLTATTEGTAHTCITGTSRAYDATPIVIEVYSPEIGTPSNAAAANVVVLLFDGATVLGRLAVVMTPAASQMRAPLLARFRTTPTAGTHQYIVKAYCSSSTGSPYFGAGAGGTGTDLAAFLRVERA